MTWEEIFKRWHSPISVFGAKVSTDPVDQRDVEQILHMFESPDEICGVFRLRDGRYVAIHDKRSESQFDGKTRPDGSFYAAYSYNEIVRLGLTNSLREQMNIQLPSSFR